MAIDILYWLKRAALVWPNLTNRDELPRLGRPKGVANLVKLEGERGTGMACSIQKA